MLATFIFGIAAGAAAVYAEPHIKSGLESALKADAPFDPAEMRGVSLALCLFLAAILAAVFGNGSAVALTVGAVLGAIGPKLIDLVKGRSTPDYGDDV